MSEGSSQLFTQPFFPSDSSTYSDGHTVVGCGLTQEKKDAVNKPRFVGFACSHSEVGAIRLKTLKVLIIHNRSIDTLYWSRKRSSQRRSGEGRRISRLSSVVRNAVPAVNASLNSWGYRHPRVYRVAKVRDPIAASRSTRHQGLEMRMVGTRFHRWQAQEAHECHRLLETAGDL